MPDWIIIEVYVTWRTLKVTRVPLLSLFNTTGRWRMRFKSKQMFCVSLHSEMKKTRCDWQWWEHAQFSHPRNSFLCQRIRTTIARLPASDLSYDGDILPWQLRFWQSQDFILLLLLSWHKLCHKWVEKSFCDFKQWVSISGSQVS